LVKIDRQTKSIALLFCLLILFIPSILAIASSPVPMAFDSRFYGVLLALGFLICYLILEKLCHAFDRFDTINEADKQRWPS
jgi:hypothetical protein